MHELWSHLPESCDNEPQPSSHWFLMSARRWHGDVSRSTVDAAPGVYRGRELAKETRDLRRRGRPGGYGRLRCREVAGLALTDLGRH